MAVPAAMSTFFLVFQIEVLLVGFTFQNGSQKSGEKRGKISSTAVLLLVYEASQRADVLIAGLFAP